MTVGPPTSVVAAISPVDRPARRSGRQPGVLEGFAAAVAHDLGDLSQAEPGVGRRLYGLRQSTSLSIPAWAGRNVGGSRTAKLLPGE
jgi:hypothetical protein